MWMPPGLEAPVLTAGALGARPHPVLESAALRPHLCFQARLLCREGPWPASDQGSADSAKAQIESVPALCVTGSWWQRSALLLKGRSSCGRHVMMERLFRNTGGAGFGPWLWFADSGLCGVKSWVGVSLPWSLYLCLGIRMTWEIVCKPDTGGQTQCSFL